jgi:hypothetical protein
MMAAPRFTIRWAAPGRASQRRAYLHEWVFRYASHFRGLRYRDQHADLTCECTALRFRRSLFYRNCRIRGRRSSPGACTVRPVSS